MKMRKLPSMVPLQWDKYDEIPYWLIFKWKNVMKCPLGCCDMQGNMMLGSMVPVPVVIAEP